jgi:signal transduction histidine kinase
VLVVDDEPAVRSLLQRQLRHGGYDAEASSNAADALSRLDAEPFALVFCDIEMPEMSGNEMLARLRASKNDVPVVFVTGNPQLDTAIEAVEHGVIRYLTKPVEMKTLVQVAGEAIRLHGVARVERLARDHEALQQLVEELDRTRKGADAANQAKVRFLDRMSDEHRSPLVGVLGMTELVLDSELSPDQREALEIVQTSANHLLGLIQNVIDVADLANHTTRPARRTFHPDAVVAGVVRALESAARAKGLALLLCLEPAAACAVVGEEAKFEQILHNVIDNAIKFTTRGGVTVRGGLRLNDGRDAVVSVLVTDTGIGVRRELGEKIFEPFFQADESVTRRHKGCGLGLTIASQLARLLGGSVDLVASAVGTGSAFRVTVPFDLAPPDPAH